MSLFIDTQYAKRSSLCGHCAEYFQSSSFLDAISESDIPGTASMTFPKRLSDVADTADQCEICKLINSHAHEFETETPEIKVEFVLGYEAHDIKRVRLIYQGPVSDEAGLATGFNVVLRTFIVHTLPGDPAARFIKNRPIEVDVGSSRSVDIAKYWLSTCCTDHPNNLAAIRLCVTRSQEDPYAALSYCWGPKQFPNLVATRNSFKDMLEKIPLSAFPPTLRDGILVTHQLGLCYLWIDALCIVQDDDDDKDNEIPQMRRIFTNAHCTIIAATAAHCQGGFLHIRELPPVSELCVPYPGPGARNGSMILRKHDPDEWILYDPLEDPVNDRAWTLEERLLSPRRLIYSKNHLRWLCETAEYTNGGDSGDRKFASSERRAQMERLPPQLSPRIKPPINTIATVTKDHDMWYAWLTIVREYNLRSLTKSKDKLRAIGGIAELYQLRTGDQYCAGMWRSHLAEELLWKVFHPRATFSTMLEEAKDPTSCSRPSIMILPRPKYRAPTWSWASVDGTAANHRALTRSPFVVDAFEVIDCVVVPEKPSALLTSVRSAVLTVRGRMRQAFLHIESLLLYWSEEDYQREEFFGSFERDALEDEQYPEFRPVHCLEITSRVRKSFVGNQQGLLLMNTDTEGVFRRVGMFGTDLLDVSYFADIEPQIVKII
ncbi:MAG: hypothetical protein Q9195_008621 [Heterodermia aff. obscurata]